MTSRSARATGVTLALVLFPARIWLQARPPMPVDSWPSYYGDFSGRRFGPLTKINDSNVNSLSLAWVYRMTAASGTVNPPRGTPLKCRAAIAFPTTRGRTMAKSAGRKSSPISTCSATAPWRQPSSDTM